MPINKLSQIYWLEKANIFEEEEEKNRKEVQATTVGKILEEGE